MDHRSYLELLERLVATPSVSSACEELDQGNQGVVELLAERLEGLGMQVELRPLSYHASKYNLVARLGAGEGGLVLAGHTDTVPCDAADWSSDPFRLERRDGRLYGLGTSDMKGFFPAVVEALRGLAEAGVRYRHPLYVVATADEESNMGGARELAAEAPLGARHALIGEPTGLRPVHAHKGALMEQLCVQGLSGHASDPERGLNAIQGVRRVLDALEEWHAGLRARYRDESFSVPGPTMNFGRIHGGDSANRICGACELGLDLRLLPGMTVEEVRGELRRVATAALEGTDYRLSWRVLFEGIPALSTSPEAEVVRAAARFSGRATGTVLFATEGACFNSMGMETVILGPGDIEQAHRADEYLEEERIAPMVEILGSLITHFCAREQPA